MSEDSIEYKNLKSEIVRKTANSLDVEKVKDYFSCIIKSRRKLSRVKNLNDIFHLLEERDALDSKNVSTLNQLGNILQNEDIKRSVRGYEKLYAEPKACSVCDKSCVYSLPIINPVRENLVQSVPNELQIAIRNISLNIGKNWRVLASELRVPECYVDEVREKHPDDFQTQAFKILEVWWKHYGESATLDSLKYTLESRLCKRKGLGLHMLKPVITME